MPDSLAAGVLSAALLAGSAFAADPSEAPPLPPPDPAVYTVIEVNTAQELADACWNLTSNQAIVIAAGTYDLATVAFPNGVDGRLTVGRYGAPPISNIQIRGATGDPADVVIQGAGMLDPIVPFGFQIFTATDVLIADLSVGNVFFHAVMIQGDQGAARAHLYHTRLFDAGQQIVKSPSTGSDGADDVVIEYSEIFYNVGAVGHPGAPTPGTCYTNGVDALDGQRWILRDNLFRRIRCQDGTLAGPALLMWRGSSDTVVERNRFLDSSRGISLGLQEGDHSGGVVRNNIVRWTPSAPYAVDVPIYTVSPGSKILHNTTLVRGGYFNAIEVRYASATGVEVRNNLTDAIIKMRNGATATVVGNETGAQPSWFVDEPAGDLRLLATATAALDQADPLPNVTDDFDRGPRPSLPGSVDLGASERSECLHCDDFESGDLSAWREKDGP